MNLENKKQIATVILALGLGLIATFLTGQYVQNSVTKQTKAMTKEYAQHTASLKKEMELNEGKLEALGQRYEDLVRLVQAMPKGGAAEPVKPQQPIDQNTFSGVMSAGKRAITIQVDTLSAIGGLLSPGDFVDVIATLKIPEGVKGIGKDKTKDVVTVLFQNLQVLAVGTLFKSIGGVGLYEDRQRTNLINVTLAVSPQEAGLLTFAQANGKLQLSLRSPLEEEEYQFLQVASWDTLTEYIMEKQGTKLSVPKSMADESLTIEPTVGSEDSESGDEELGPDIQIFRGGKEL